MSWYDALLGAAQEFDEEFGMLARITPMLSRPNRRSEPDPRRPPFEIEGVYHEGNKPMGDSRRNTDGMSETKITSRVVAFSVFTQNLPFPLTQGDEIHVCELNRTFRVMDIGMETIARVLFTLEDVQSPPL